MSDDPHKHALDGKLISLTQDHEVAYWTKALGVPVEDLAAAVEAVGHSAADVRAWLANRDNPTQG